LYDFRGKIKLGSKSKILNPESGSRSRSTLIENPWYGSRSGSALRLMRIRNTDSYLVLTYLCLSKNKKLPTSTLLLKCVVPAPVGTWGLTSKTEIFQDHSMYLCLGFCCCYITYFNCNDYPTSSLQTVFRIRIELDRYGSGSSILGQYRYGSGFGSRFFKTKIKDNFFLEKLINDFQSQIAKKTLIEDSQAQLKPIRPSA